MIIRLTTHDTPLKRALKRKTANTNMLGVSSRVRGRLSHSSGILKRKDKGDNNINKTIPLESQRVCTRARDTMRIHEIKTMAVEVANYKARKAANGDV